MDPELVSLAQTILTHVVAGDWWPAAAAAVAALAIAVRRWGPKVWPPLGSIPGVIISAFVLAGAGGLLNAVAAGAAVTFGVVLTALKVGLAAAGGWGALETLARIFFPQVFGGLEVGE